jgi:hypothetical protein
VPYFIREGLTVAIHRKVPDKRPGANPGATRDVTVPTFSYENDGLADLIVAAWANDKYDFGGAVKGPHFQDALLDRDTTKPLPYPPTAKARDTAREAVNFYANMDLKSVVVITEEEHDNDYTTEDVDEVTLVLPRDSRLAYGALSGAPYAPDLLETAKLLMSCTPNGI